MKQVVFLTVNHRGPLPLRELHFTDETGVWRDLGEFWACLRPVSNNEWISPAGGCDTDMYVTALRSRSFFLRWITADPSPWGNFTPPTKQECGETLRDLESVYDLFPITSEFLSLITTCFQWRVSWPCLRLWRRHVWGSFVDQGSWRRSWCFRWNIAEPSRLGNLTGKTWFWEDLGGVGESAAYTCFRSPTAGTKTCGLVAWTFTWQMLRTPACRWII